MGYTKEAVSDTTSAIPNQAPSIMREEAVFNPYGKSVQREAILNKVTNPIGQPNKDGSTGAADPASTEATVTLSPQVAALARKEQKFRQQELALKAREAAIEAKVAKVAKLEAMEAKLAAKDYSGLDGIVDYNEYSQYQVAKLNGSDPTQEEIRALRADLAAVKSSQEESTSKLFDSLVAERRTLVNKLVDSSPDFSGLKKMNMQEHVVQHILDTWEHDNVELSVEDAAKEIKEELLQRKKRYDDAFATAASPVDERKPLPPLKPGLKTITNQVTAAEITQPRKSLQFMSDAERWAEARRRAEAKLQAKQG